MFACNRSQVDRLTFEFFSLVLVVVVVEKRKEKRGGRERKEEEQKTERYAMKAVCIFIYTLARDKVDKVKVDKLRFKFSDLIIV